MIFAAVDIGSNAARLLFANVFEMDDKTWVEKATLVRIPTRLGEDVYTNNYISDEKADRLIKTLKGFKLLIEAYNPIAFDACATAAMREAKNGEKLLNRIKTEAGFEIRLIDGFEEANIIRQTKKLGFENPDNHSLYIDVGGGSTDISLAIGDEILEVDSFKIGTLRMLKEKVKKKEWARMRQWLTEKSEKYGKLNVIGSGGNINKINKMFGDTLTYTLTYKDLKSAWKYLKKFSLEDRINDLGLRPDRADVIVPAAEIFLFALDIINTDKILVPKIGLADGLVFKMYQERMRKK